jgi:hypothetical protein
MAKGRITSHICECGQIFNSKREFDKHRQTDCPLRGVPNDEPAEPATDDRQADLVKAIAEAKAAIEDKPADGKPADDKPAAPTTNEPAPDAPPKVDAKTDPVIIPYSLCDKRIGYLSSTRPIIIGVECRKRDEGLEVRRVLPGWK